MYIPSNWKRAAATEKAPNGQELSVSAWGWGDNERAAKERAADRLQKLLAKIRRGEPFPKKYAYGKVPLREEIIETIGGKDRPAAVITRNHFGATVLNTARLLFLDIDIARATPWQRFLRRVGLKKGPPEPEALVRLRGVLESRPRSTFRIYRTAGGLRALAVDREVAPAGREAKELMEATGTDPAFMHLCAVQESFRARLTPKHWRCGVSAPPGNYPRGTEQSRLFASWLNEYQRACESFAACRYLETVGDGRARGDLARLIDLHDRATRCDEDLPLA